MNRNISRKQNIPCPITGIFIRPRARIKNALTAAVLLLVSFMLIVSIISMDRKISQKEKQLTELNAQLDTVKQGAEEIKAKTDEKVSLEQIEEVAVKKYGMVPRDELEVKYVHIAQPDESFVTAPEMTNNDTFSVFSAIGRTVKKILEYITE